jgi:dTDP-4-dehydrorhamnose reductase
VKKIYITGSRGMVGSRFLELLPKDLTALTPEIDKLDITDKLSVDSFFELEKPDITLHFAAFTDVGAAESQRGDKNGSCWKINVEGSVNLAEACKKYGSHMIHISTDYCFSGSSEDPGPYSENHPIEINENKLTWYGFTKAETEREVVKILGDNLSIVRLIYPVRGKFDAKLDYIRKPLSLFDQGKLYPLFTDQQLSITYIDEACYAINKIIEGKIYGIFHASTPDTTTPYDLINYVVETVRGIKDSVKKSSLDKFLRTVDNPVRYPKFGGLKVEETQKALGIKFSSWREVVDKLKSDLSTS